MFAISSVHKSDKYLRYKVFKSTQSENIVSTDFRLSIAAASKMKRMQADTGEEREENGKIRIFEIEKPSAETSKQARRSSRLPDSKNVRQTPGEQRIASRATGTSVRPVPKRNVHRKTGFVILGSKKDSTVPSCSKKQTSYSW